MTNTKASSSDRVQWILI